MKRYLWLLMACCWLMAATAANANTLMLDLEHLKAVNLVSNSRYLIDSQHQLTVNQALASTQWQALNRDQLRFGLDRATIWLDMSIETQGDQAHDTLLVFNRIIDTVQVDTYQNGAFIKTWHQGVFLHHPAGFIGTNKNTMPLRLEPNSQYRFIVQLRGTDSITGSIKLWDRENYQTEDSYNLYAFIAYAVMVLAIALYNIAIFISTKYRAFLYHAIYGLSFLSCQAGQYGYWDGILQYSAAGNVKDTLILFCCLNAYSAVMGLIYEILADKKEVFFNGLLKTVVLINSVTALLAPFLTLQSGLVIFGFSMVLGIFLGTTHGLYLMLKADKRFLKILLMIVLFSPSSILLVLSRFGVIDDSFWSEYWILIAIIGEMLLLSGLMFRHIHQLRELFWRSQFLDPRNQLPNILALQKHLQHIQRTAIPYALTYTWIAGMEKMEVARGSAFRDEYLKAFAALVERHFLQEGFGLTAAKAKKTAPLVFYCEKNTLAFITLPLDNLQHECLQRLVECVFDRLKSQYSYNLDVTPIIASCNAIERYIDIDVLLQNTNVALSQCIQRNNTLLLYNDDVGFNERRQIALLNDFATALEQNQFYLEWQPQCDPLTQHLSGLEALVRWRHPVYGIVSPAQFIPLLEQNFLITRLSSWVLKQVFALSPAFLKRFPELDISVNLSVYDLMHDHLLPILDGLLLECEQPMTSRIILEVTESMHMEDNARVLKTVAALQARGFRISIDDFGAGYASFGYLQTLPANELKIDKRYTDTCHEASSQAIIFSIIELAKRLNMQIVVEGIEDKEQQELFAHWGVHRLQGWRLGKPAQQHEILASF